MQASTVPVENKQNKEEYKIDTNPAMYAAFEIAAVITDIAQKNKYSSFRNSKFAKDHPGFLLMCCCCWLPCLICCVADSNLKFSDQELYALKQLGNVLESFNVAKLIATPAGDPRLFSESKLDNNDQAAIAQAVNNAASKTVIALENALKSSAIQLTRPYLETIMSTIATTHGIRLAAQQPELQSVAPQAR